MARPAPRPDILPEMRDVLTGTGDAPVADAATVVLVRDGDAGLECLMLRKTKGQAFGGLWVFPGGRVEAGDGEGFEGVRRAAVREAQEETGLLLEPTELVPFAHWFPPPEAPRRFATWFFLAALPGGAAEVIVDGGEIGDHVWTTPSAALDRHRAGEIKMVPPTWVTRHRPGRRTQPRSPALQHPHGRRRRGARVPVGARRRLRLRQPVGPRAPASPGDGSRRLALPALGLIRLRNPARRLARWWAVDDDDVTADARPWSVVATRNGDGDEAANEGDAEADAQAEADLARRLGWAKQAILAAALVFLGIAIGLVVARDRPPGAGSVDVGFLQDMLTHHDQALGVATLVIANGDDEDVRELAARTARNQAGEINEYRALAERNGYEIEIEPATVPAAIAEAGETGG